MNLFSFVKNNVSILEVVGEYATLKKAGLYWKGVCPFHHEKTPSFTVSPHKGIFYCFGCHEGGDAISFIEKAEQCSALESAHFLTERYSIDIPEDLLKQNTSQQTTDQQNEEKKRYFRLCQTVARWCHENFNASPALKRYMKGRSFDEAVLNTYMVGYFPGGQKAIKRLIEYAQKEGFIAQDLVNAHILAQGKTVLYSPFEERILFPIKDHLGRNVGFGGRIYKKDDDRAKYYNSKEHTYFLKGSLLFGMDQAKPHIQERGSVFLVEGYTDCLAMAQYGFTNTVATLGTSCTLEHLTSLSRYSHNLYILYDGDSAGKKAMIRLTELCWQVDLELKIVELPTGDDPASFLQGRGDLKSLTAHAQDIFEFFIKTSADGYVNKSLNEKVQTLKNFLSIIDRLTDPLKKEILLKRAAEAFDITLSTLKRGLEKNKQSSYQQTTQKPEKDEPDNKDTIQRVLKEIPLLEKKLFSVIINNVQMLKPEEESYLLEYLNPALQDLLGKAISLKNSRTDLDFVRFFDELNDQERILASNLVLECQEYEGPENLDYLLTHFQKKNWKSFVADVKMKLHRTKVEHNEEEMKRILRSFQELKQKLVSRGLI